MPACPPFRFPRILGEAIAYGRQGTPIGGYLDGVGGPLARQDIRDLVHWLRETAGVEPLVIDPEKGHDRLAADAADGARVYRAHCASCHGNQGEGGTGTALGNAAMLALTPDHFLRHPIVEGRQGTPMPAFAGILSATEMDNLTAFLRRPPPLDRYVINPEGEAPRFGELKDGRYLSATVLDRELRARRRMVLLDTRVTSMWQMAHIEGAVPVPVLRQPRAGGGQPAARQHLDRCLLRMPARGGRTRWVKWLPEEGGFGHTAVLYEGIRGWVSLGYPVVAGDASK